MSLKKQKSQGKAVEVPVNSKDEKFIMLFHLYSYLIYGVQYMCCVYTAKRGDRTNLQTKYSLIYCFSLLQEHKFFSRSNPGHFVDLKNLKKCKVVSNNCARLCKEFRRHRIPMVFFNTYVQYL
jgi:hypothetical protein